MSWWFWYIWSSFRLVNLYTNGNIIHRWLFKYRSFCNRIYNRWYCKYRIELATYCYSLYFSWRKGTNSFRCCWGRTTFNRRSKSINWRRKFKNCWRRRILKNCRWRRKRSSHYSSSGRKRWGYSGGSCWRIWSWTRINRIRNYRRKCKNLIWNSWSFNRWRKWGRSLKLYNRKNCYCIRWIGSSF